ncbi:hypothetical protein G7054_g4692 [Neopestalotiopsis clavispora]|nr:hypothetical protein G7054_g4692 [Neopestalotiopsis clavispora]
MPSPSASQEVESIERTMEQEVRVLIRRLLDSRRVTAGNNLVPSSKAQVHNLLANKYLLVDEQEYNALKYNGSRSVTFSEGLTSQNDSEFRDFTAAADRLHVKAQRDKRRRPSTLRLQRLKSIESAQARRPPAILEFTNGLFLRTHQITYYIDPTIQNKDGEPVGSIVGICYRCNTCNESFNSKDLYDRHVVDRHSVVLT